jgi:hypothetical protein
VGELSLEASAKVEPRQRDASAPEESLDHETTVEVSSRDAGAPLAGIPTPVGSRDARGVGNGDGRLRGRTVSGCGARR